MESDVMVAFLFERRRTAHVSHLQHMDIQDGASCHTLYSSVIFDQSISDSKVFAKK